MASSILYPRKTPGGGEERGRRGEISQGEEEGEREREMSWREEDKKKREREISHREEDRR